MSKIEVKNNREHDITLAINLDGEGRIEQVTIPGSTQDPDDKSKWIPGSQYVDPEFIDLARAKSAVCDSYFAQGWLTEAEKRKVKAEPAPSKTPAPAPAPAKAPEPDSSGDEK